MVRRYYCDFCNKKFVDNITHRRNHLRSVTHQRNRKLHYSNIKNPLEILQEDSGKKPCRTFFTTGDCKFGPECRFSHLTDEHRKELQMKVAAQKRQEAGHPVTSEMVDRAISKVENKEEVETVSSEWNLRLENLVTIPRPGSMLPRKLLDLPALPPSLIPPPSLEDFALNFSDW